MSNATTSTSTTPATADKSRTVFLSLIGVASVIVLLQALWAGLFVHEGEDYEEKWVTVHARAADLAILLAVIALVTALVKLRSRTDLVVGAAVFAVALVLEAYIGGIVGDHPGATAIHFPLAMALMALSVWLPLRATRA